jgi:PAS domain S-box-containing protein
MRIRTRIIGAALIVVLIVNIIYMFYFVDKSRQDALVRLQSNIQETNSLLRVVTAGPLYDGNIEQLNTDLDSFFINPDIVEVNLREYQGDIVISRKRDSLSRIGELIKKKVIISRGIDELGEISVTYTTANIEMALIKNRDRLIFFSLLLMIGLSLVIFLVANHLTRPIDRFTEAARAMANGKLDQNIETRGARELRIMGQSFIRMRDAIQEKIADLAEKNKQLNEEIQQRISVQQALKESEEKYRSLFEKSVNPMLLARGLQFVDGNAAALKLLGLESVEELQQLTASDISPEKQPDGEDTKKLIDETMTSLKQQGGSAYFEWYYKRKNGEVFPVAMSLTVIGMEDGEPVTHVIWQDISDRKLAEEELFNYRQHLEELVEDRTNELTAVNKELEAFSFSVSHDLRAPLRSIDGFSQALLEDYSTTLDTEGLDYLERIRAAAQRMGHLIDALLELSRVTRRELKRQSVDLSALAEEVMHDLQQIEPERKVDCSIQGGMQARGDKQLLHIVLANLLGNAWKYTGKQTEAQIKFGCKTENDETVYFVEDNGAGFNMAYAKKLFGAFQRMHRSDEFPGTGVGLATVSRIINKHGGRIWAQSEPGKGSTFFFTLD